MKIQKIPADVAVVVGRFQVHELHPGHKELLDFVTKEYDQVIIVLGCSPLPNSIRNPLSWQARQIMLNAAYPNTIITHLNDSRSNEEWSAALDKVVKNHLRPNQSCVLVGSRDSFIQHYNGKYQTMEVVGDNEDIWSGTEVRKQLANKVLTSPDFRHGVIHQSCGYYPAVVPTVDIAVFENEKRQDVYLVRKNGEDKFRFPGGFCEPGSNYERDAIREVKEEIGDIEINYPEYIGNFEIDDWRLRHEPHKIRTVFFQTYKLWGPIKPKDTEEIAEVKLFNKYRISKNEIVPEHHILLDALLDHKHGELG